MTNPGESPNLTALNFITAANVTWSQVLPWKVTYSQVPGMRTWTSLGAVIQLAALFLESLLSWHSFGSRGPSLPPAWTPQELLSSNLGFWLGQVQERSALLPNNPHHPQTVTPRPRRWQWRGFSEGRLQPRIPGKTDFIRQMLECLTHTWPTGHWAQLLTAQTRPCPQGADLLIRKKDSQGRNRTIGARQWGVEMEAGRGRVAS